MNWMQRKSGPSSHSVGLCTIKGKPSNNEMQLTLGLHLTPISRQPERKTGNCGIGKCVCPTAGGEGEIELGRIKGCSKLKSNPLPQLVRQF